MALLIILIILLVLAVVFFVTFPIFKRRIFSKNYNAFCDRKIRVIANKNQLNFLSNFKLNLYGEEDAKIDHIIFGRKYIYILTNYYFDGDIKGTSDNNSWILNKRGNNGSEYIDNISNQLSRKNGVFSSKISANPELILPIAILNNDCAINVNGINNNNTFVIHYSSLKKLIKNLESRDIADIDSEKEKNIYENLVNENEER